MKRLAISTAVISASLGLMPHALAQHAHVNAGALSTAAGTPLAFINGATFSTNTGFVLPLAVDAAPPYAGLYRGSLTFTSLPATLETGGPAFGHAAPGAFLELEIVRLVGPAGGEFALWEEDENSGDVLRRFAVPVGPTAGMSRVPLTESDASPGSDPYGHVHGRQFTVNLPGLYTLGVRVVDTSANGLGGGPIQTPSAVLDIYLNAGLTIASIDRTNLAATIRFGTQAGRTYVLEASNELGEGAAWRTVAGPLAAMRSEVATLVHLAAGSSPRFYRLRMTVP